MTIPDEFVTVPDTTLPGGLFVPSFQVFKYAASRGERRHFYLYDQVIFDVAGNVYEWVFDDVQGDERGLVAKKFTADTPSRVIPFPAEQKGQGWTPPSDYDWSGRALVRGGCWSSGSHAGVFGLGGGWPGSEVGGVGFRCTKPIGL